jgi:acetyl esterase/lipase
MAESSSFALEQLARLPLVYPVPPSAPQRHTFIYRAPPEGPLQADVYRPADLPAGQRRPCVIMIHAGPVARQANPRDWRMFQDYATLLAALGVITVVFDHRLHGPTAYFTARGDVAALLEHVRAHAAAYDIDPDRLVLWAFAGSGPLLTVAMNPRQPCICGLIAYYCVLDFATSAKAGAQATREILESLSPATQLRRDGWDAPVLLVRAGRDSPAVNRSVETFMETALRCDVPVELLNHPSGTLGFEVRNDDARSREIIARTLEFIRARAL